MTNSLTRSMARWLLAGFLLTAIVSDAVAQTVPPERRIRHREQSLLRYEPFHAEEMWKRIKVPPAPALSPADALKSFEVAPGFRLETVAAEPLVVDPVAFEFDADGRIWVVELRGYMQDIDGSTEGDPIGQIVVLEDTDGDTFMDQSTVFLGELVMARTVSFVAGGVLVQEPPHLWFCEDTNGDLKCDRKRLVGQFGRPGDPQHTDNSLYHAIDNWMYNAKSSVRHKFRRGELLAEETFFRGQWGINQDDYGRLFYCYESSPLHVDLVPAELMYRNRNFQHALSGGRNTYGLNVPFRKETHEVYPIRVAPGITLGAHELRDDGTLRTFTIAAGVSIYRGDQFPAEYAGCAVIPEAGGNLVRLNQLTTQDGVYLDAHNAFGTREWVASTDERFRPLNSRTGPDGAVYVCDMYKGIIEHVVFMMPYLRRYIEQQGLEKPVGMGRIYRIRHVDKPLGQVPKLSQADSSELVRHLSHANGWWRDTSQRLLVEREAVDQADALRTLATEGENHLGRLHALWTLEGIGQLDWHTTRLALTDDNALVRATATRLAARFANGNHRSEVLASLHSVLDDDRAVVRLQLLLTLGAWQGHDQAERAMVDVISQHHDDLFHAAAVSGLEGRELEFIERVLTHAHWQDDRPEKRGLLAMLAMAVFNEQDPERVDQLLNLADRQRGDSSWRRDEIVHGIANSHFSRAKWPPPITLKQKPALLDTLHEDSNQLSRDAADRLARVITWPGDATERPVKPTPRPLSTEEKEQYGLGQAIYAVTCHACHHHDGQGQAGKAPPLVESEWIHGAPEQLVRIVLHGLTGPVDVRGQQWNLTMPGLGHSPALDDRRLAAVLTYVGRAWDNWADPIPAEFVSEIRRHSNGRTRMWTAAELRGADPATVTSAAAVNNVTEHERLERLTAGLAAGDAERGRGLFHTNLQLRCPACHVVGETGGGFVGPELTHVGSRATQQALLESLIDPSAKIATGFDTIVVLTASGQSVAGTLVAENESHITLAPPAGGTTTVEQHNVTDRFTSPISSMPPVAALFTPDEIGHLVAYLESLQKPTSE